MANDTASTAEDRAIDALTRVLDSAIAPEMLEAQRLILRRLALSGDLFPARVPPPQNITEAGGYLNLVEGDPIIHAQALAAILGVAGPNPAPGWDPVLPPLYLSSHANDRPAEVAAITPVTYSIRNDFVTSFDQALAVIHALGGLLPVLAMSRPLPPLMAETPPAMDLLAFMGRVLELLPGAALTDPVVDVLAVGQAGAAGPQVVAARQLDPAAPEAGTIAAADWSFWSCDASACAQGAVNGVYFNIAPTLNDAGWYAGNPFEVPISLGAPGNWNRWTNITGLVAGVSTVGYELEMLYSAGEIAASRVREMLDWVWDGIIFVAPG